MKTLNLNSLTLSVLGITLTLVITTGRQDSALLRPTTGLVSQIDTTSDDDLPSTKYTILSTEQHGTFINQVVLIDPLQSPSDLLVIAKVFEMNQCQEVVCNTVSFWDSEPAYQLYLSKADDKSWLQHNWPKVCEANVAEYTVSAKEIKLYPLMDSQYYQYGGKRKRPSPGTVNL